MVAYSDNWTTDSAFNSSVVKSRFFAVASNWVARCLSSALLVAAARLVVGAGTVVLFARVAFLRSFGIAEHVLEKADASLAWNRHPMTRAWITVGRRQAQGDERLNERRDYFASASRIKSHAFASKCRATGISSRVQLLDCWYSSSASFYA